MKFFSTFLFHFNLFIFNEILQYNIFNYILIWFYKTPLCLAVKKENIGIVKLLLAHKDINVNIRSILTQIFNKIHKKQNLITFNIHYY